MHRIQRVPTTEKTKSRVHTSSVFVNVVLPDQIVFKSTDVKEDDLTVSWFSGTGAGGQHRNKHQNSCRITHKPTGIVVCAQTRSQVTSKQQAVEELQRKLKQQANADVIVDTQSLIQKQLHDAQKLSSRRRLYRFQEGLVYDCVSNKKLNIEKYMTGQIHLIW